MLPRVDSRNGSEVKPTENLGCEIHGSSTDSLLWTLNWNNFTWNSHKSQTKCVPDLQQFTNMNLVSQSTSSWLVQDSCFCELSIFSPRQWQEAKNNRGVFRASAQLQKFLRVVGLERFCIPPPEVVRLGWMEGGHMDLPLGLWLQEGKAKGRWVASRNGKEHKSLRRNK